MILSIAAIIFALYAVIGFFILIGLWRIPKSQPVEENQPLVSILISCRNEEEDLPQCLKSLEKLTYPQNKLQLILVDDNSTDTTPDILKTFADKHPHAEFYSD